MARNADRNLQLSTFAEYDVSNWAALGESVQQLYIDILRAYGETAEGFARDLVSEGKGPGPHPHRDDHGFSWVDTGELAKAVKHRIVRRGFMQSVQVYVEPINGVDYGTFLEIGWHPVVPDRFGKGTRHTGRFYRYPWLSVAMASANRRVPTDVRTLWKSRMRPIEAQFRVAAQRRGRSGGVRASGFVVSQNITEEVRNFRGTADTLGKWLSKTKLVMPPGILP